jgi:hypothetical protein
MSFRFLLQCREISNLPLLGPFGEYCNRTGEHLLLLIEERTVMEVVKGGPFCGYFVYVWRRRRSELEYLNSWLEGRVKFA